MHVHMVSTSAGGFNESATASCTSNGHTGEIAIGGGASVSGTISQVAIQSTQAVGGDLTTAPTGWTGSARRFCGGGGYTLTVRVICATAPAP